jgi:eukaryotic-like serine/threonine-protein kinase
MSPASPQRFSRLGRYEILGELGRGAMGRVYLARDPLIGRLVALKTIHIGVEGLDDSEAREFRERFLREAQAAGILSHPNIVTIHDVAEDRETGLSYIAMEYIEGKTLKMAVRQKTRLAYARIAEVISQVADALDYAHRKGIVHRDIKPANIIITADDRVKITDFGIARIASSDLTTKGRFLGTPNYTSPEQITGGPVDGRSDIFSLGVVLYELLTRQKPFQGENMTTVSFKVVNANHAPPSEIEPGTPAGFDAIVRRAMAKDPAHRFARGKDFALALDRLRSEFLPESSPNRPEDFLSFPAPRPTQSDPTPSVDLPDEAIDALWTDEDFGTMPSRHRWRWPLRAGAAAAVVLVAALLAIRHSHAPAPSPAATSRMGTGARARPAPAEVKPAGPSPASEQEDTDSDALDPHTPASVQVVLLSSLSRGTLRISVDGRVAAQKSFDFSSSSFSSQAPVGREVRQSVRVAPGQGTLTVSLITPDGAAHHALPIQTDLSPGDARTIKVHLFKNHLLARLE